MPIVVLSPVGGAGQQFFDNSGNVLSGGLLYTYAAGTTTPLTTYTSSSGTVANTNPIVLDSAGRCGEVWLLFGTSYKFVLKTSAGVTLGTWDNVSGSSGSNFQIVADLTALSAITGLTNGIRVLVTDLGFYRYDSASTDTVNGASVVATSSGTGRWLLEVDGVDWTDTIFDVTKYGAVGNGSTDDYAAIVKAIAAATSGSTLYFPPSSGFVSSAALTIPAGIDVIMDSALIYNGSSTPMASPLLTIGTTNTNNTRRRLRLNVYRNTVSTWADGTEWWQPAVGYTVNDVCRNGYRTYTCIVAGTSSASGGPTGTESYIADGVATWVLSADMVAGNTGTVTVTIGTTSTPVPFTYALSHLDTMNTLAAAIDSVTDVTAAVVGGASNRTITISVTAGKGLSISSTAITGGVSQPTVTVTNPLMWQYTAATWETDIGVRLYGIYTSDIEIEAYGFTVGAQLFGDGAGMAYNNVQLRNIQNNKIGIDLCSTTSGWANENVFIGGRFWVASGVNRGIDRYGVRIVSRDGGYLSHNGNSFIKPSFEMNASNCTANSNYTGTARAIGICLSDSQKNTVHDCRDEDNTALAEFRATSGDNITITGYGGTPTFLQYASSANNGYYGNTKLPDRCTRLVFSIPDIASVYGPYTSGTPRVQVPGCAWGNSTNGSLNKAQTNITIGTDYLEWGTTRDLGVRVDTSSCKEFTMVSSGPSGAGGRVMVRCYDSSGTQLDPSVVANVTPYVRGDILRPFSESSDGGGSYRTGADTNAPIYMLFSSEVQSAQISIRGGTANAQIRAFAVYAGPGNSGPRCWAGYSGDTEYRPVATEIPSIGTATAGKTVWHATPTVGQPIGWMCTVSGSPGTWVAMANL